ncbi:uncharacterized protein LOC113352141 [Papaver somniferum]|uniref:uncharacterized protein LOC113352141 n=1 Tax=Papaver somniferum TaxID=3469 RepID=UPI000E6FDF36|nr:uncharacterized protein LOC113352141 [Papaver somniferum]
MVSRCYFCKKAEESLEHVLWNCNYSEIIWSWLGGMFCFKNPKSFEEILNSAKQRSPAVKEIWRVAAFITLKELWFQRNMCVYDEESFNEHNIKTRIMKFTTESEVRMKNYMWNTTYDLQILKHFGMKYRKLKFVVVKEIFFKLPQSNQLLLCCDGASRGNPWIAGYGIIARNNAGDCVIAIAGGLGIATNFFAEIMAVFCAGEWAIKNGFSRLLFRSDSKAAIAAFKNAKVPWFAIPRWEKICQNVREWDFIHSYREIYFFS